MLNLMLRCCFCITAALSATHAFSQTLTINGNVKNSITGDIVPAVSVTLKGSATGTFTNDKGDFKLTTVQKPPFTLVISSIGYEQQEVQVSNAGASVLVNFVPASALGSEIVVSASRVPERILESPVSIERVNTTSIRSAPASSYYDIIRTLKGVDVTTASLTFNSVTTRGFNGSGNTRFNQFVDDMDNQAPGLNFSVGSVIGLTELDVDNMELLPGASSALYGSGGMNGTLLISSKNPFKYQGLSVQIKQGVMHVGNKAGDPIGASPYFDWSFRYGKKVSEKFAFKMGAQFVQAKDWIATDTSNYSGAGTGATSKQVAGTRKSDPNYDGVNVYGDETSVDIRAGASPFLQGVAQQIIAANPAAAPAVQGILASDAATPFFVSRTGYSEQEVINNNTVNFKASGGLYYKLTPATELSLTGNWGTGNTVYTETDRYSLKGLKVGQYKLEVRNSKWFLRAYTTRENAGQSYNATISSQLFNEAWKPSYNAGNAAGSWFPQYAGAYMQARLGGASKEVANNAARMFADIGRPAAGTDDFNNILNTVTSKPIPKGGRFVDRTSLWQTEGQYNFTDLIKFAEVLAGASWRQYILNSEGTLFADSAGRIHTNEYGAYLQVSKRIFNEKLRLTASGRYDKNENFKGKFTPRFSAVYAVAKDHNIRASYQNAYRFPSNQNQWINLNSGLGILLGGLPELRDYYKFNTNPVYKPSSVQAFGGSALAGSPNPALLVVQTFDEFKPETVNSYELGYKGLFNKRVLIDVYGYYSSYKNFIGRISVLQSNIAGNPAGLLSASTRTGYSVSVNSSNKVNTYGGGIGVDLLLNRNFTITANGSTDNIDNPDPLFATYFNSPKYRFNVGFGNSGLGKHKMIGFNVQYRWQDSFFNESNFKQGSVPAFGTLDGQVSFKLTNIHSLIKVGATNILNKYYKTAYGNPQIGGLYYVSLGYNVF